jgi:(p)ppGpp synthase/HD superfamily hydrolase
MKLNWSQDNYIKAYKFAAHAHQGQLYPGTEISYIMHLSFVSMEILGTLSVEECNGDFALQCSILHDTIEDTGTTFEQLKSEFGLTVALGVRALTKNASLPKHEQMQDSLQRIKEQPREIWMVKLADRITNLQAPPPHWQQDKIIQYREEAIKIYETLKDASEFLAARLASKIENYLKLTNEFNNS